MKKQQVPRMNIVSFLSWLLWCAAKVRLSVFRFPVSIVVLIVPLMLTSLDKGTQDAVKKC